MEAPGLEALVRRDAIRYPPPESSVDVRDRGPGAPEEALPRLFDAFYRVDSDRNRNRGGIGLGPSIAHRAHRGLAGTQQ